ncbi:hypothetical protein E1281_25605 [Actinomadura sp. KC345]|uniref:hypothetical protein n=1 Tax=Actinomadura sp. KC345 TaxID=2530371 RepID=UPI001042A69E|nr:hypothetical protein [Actinomadura sp. KC345]TDC47861.1 hypothetical protein E1281_25605 [Actinomadura sp. KC345]
MKKKSFSNHLIAAAVTAAIAAALVSIAIIVVGVADSGGDFVDILRVFALLALLVVYAMLIAAGWLWASNTVALGIFFTAGVALASADIVLTIGFGGAYVVLAGIAHFILRASRKKGERRLGVSLPERLRRHGGAVSYA